MNNDWKDTLMTAGGLVLAAGGWLLGKIQSDRKMKKEIETEIRVLGFKQDDPGKLEPKETLTGTVE